METLRIAICEDDSHQRQHLLQLLQQSQYPIAITQFTCGEDFLSHFQPFQYDLILMDIFMSGLTGIDVITQVRKTDEAVPVAFITSSQDFTRESYHLSALKYIEKPITPKAVLETLQLAHMKQQMVERLLLRSRTGTSSYPLLQIVYIEQKGRTLMLHLADGTQVCATKKLDEVALQLSGKHFLRCHKSYLVNLAFVCGINATLSTFTMSQGDNVHIRRESFWMAKKAFESYLFGMGQEAQNG